MPLSMALACMSARMRREVYRRLRSPGRPDEAAEVVTVRGRFVARIACGETTFQAPLRVRQFAGLA